MLEILDFVIPLVGILQHHYWQVLHYNGNINDIDKSLVINEENLIYPILWYIGTLCDIILNFVGYIGGYLLKQFGILFPFYDDHSNNWWRWKQGVLLLCRLWKIL